MFVAAPMSLQRGVGSLRLRADSRSLGGSRICAYAMGDRGVLVCLARKRTREHSKWLCRFLQHILFGLGVFLNIMTVDGRSSATPRLFKSFPANRLSSRFKPFWASGPREYYFRTRHAFDSMLVRFFISGGQVLHIFVHLLYVARCVHLYGWKL